MENWNNVSVVIDKEERNKHKMLALAKKLVASCIKGDKEEVKKLLKNTGVSPNCTDANMTPLLACINYDHLELGKYLVRVGAQINYKENVKLEDAVWFAIRNSSYSFLSFFVKENCYLEPNEEKETLLIFATKNSDLEAVKILLSHKFIKINERDKVGNTAFHYNVMKVNPSNDDIEIGKLLLAAGADKSAINFDGQTPFELAGTEFVPLIEKQDIDNSVAHIPTKKANNNKIKL